DLAVAADRKPLDGRDPELFDAAAAEFIGRRVVRPGEPPVDLVHISEVALQVPDERDAAVIEVGQIDAGAEDSTATVFWMFDDPAAQHDDFREIVEQREIDTDFHGIQRALIFRIEKPRMVIGHDRPLRRTLAPASSTTPSRRYCAARST